MKQYKNRLVSLCLFALAFASCKTITCTPSDLGLPPGIVVFTFDDGPNVHENTTIRLLAVLEKYEIKGAFALLGINAEHNPDVVRRIAGGGHILINHGYGEKWAFFLNKEAFTANLRAGEEAISTALGKTPDVRIYRPQGGFYTKKQQKIWEEEGYVLASGTIRVYDAVLSAKDKDKIVNNVIKKVEVQNGGIILLHDARDSYKRMEANLVKNPEGDYNRTWIPDAVEEIIIILLEKGYRFEDPIF